MKRFDRRLLIPLTLILALVGALVLPSWLQTSADMREETAWSTATKPKQGMHNDNHALEVGTRFTTIRPGKILGLKFYGADTLEAGRTGFLRATDGTILGQVNFFAAPAGWQEARFAGALPVTARTEYLITYAAADGEYAGDNDFFNEPLTQGSLVLINGVYRYQDSENFRSYRNTNYYVQPIFQASGVVQPQVTGGPPASAPASSSASRIQTRQVDGGLDYYSKFEGSLPVSPNYFPIGVWFESINSAGDIAKDKALGINVYAELTNNSDLDLLAGSGMKAIVSRSDKFPERAGYILSDETDMWAGAGNDKWTGNSPGEGDVCIPKTGKCGFSLMGTLAKEVPMGSMVYNNYGKGVAFTLSDQDAASFVNQYQDVVSVDTYWFTDKHICGQSEGGQLLTGGVRGLAREECRLAANYGKVIERVRGLMSASKPVWAFVEVGHPASEAEAPTITGPQIRAAVWSSIIHGARGVVYFNHSFGGDCISAHVLRDSCGDAVRQQVKNLNLQLTRLAPVLNAPFLDGFAASTSDTDVTTKVFDGDAYVLAGSLVPDGHTSEIKISCEIAETAEVVDENRTVPIKGGRFTDSFADGNSVHIYRVNLPEGC